ncbi:hypothetical protein NBRC110019_20800 [Neptunitalea chrysea]|uniref:Uncharacterized protein n=1 Tax=Neptunitalea chrysea TaxID=1647581 RepID=A0A9W6B7K2_9FLAO|nr:hypothetical protein [Neptunitalea chrysea]GLB53040.1 hypothetical protein NBRC110019_20800 [Neptunitalea chrysea]
MLVEKLKEIASARGMSFQMGDEHWQNLLDVADDANKPFAEKVVHMLLFSEKEATAYGTFGTEKETYSAVFLLAVKSAMTDPDFDYKYEAYIQPLKLLAKSIEKEEFTMCENLVLTNYSIEGWRENYLDANVDCVEVHITAEYYG